MKMNKKIIALTAILFGMTGWAGDSAPFLLDTTDPLITAPFTYNSSWIGGDPSAEVVIVADGTEIKRTTGEGEFAWSPTTAGKHILTYTTYINGVAQDEVYEAIVYSDWKYTVTDGKATIVETTQKSGSVTIPSEIDGSGQAFALKVDGNSMINAGINDRDVIIVRKQENANNGDIVVALVDDSATVKRFFKTNDKIILHPENDEMSDWVFDDVKILGIVKGLIRKF